MTVEAVQGGFERARSEDMDVCKLTRKLVARGCPEHPRWVLGEVYFDDGCYVAFLPRPALYEPNTRVSSQENENLHLDEDDAKAIWTMWALEWVQSREDVFTLERAVANYSATIGSAALLPAVSDILEAIEAATRHLEPSHSQEA